MQGDVAAAGVTRVGRRTLPPVHARAVVLEWETGREQPRSWSANAAPGPPAGSLTPRMWVSSARAGCLEDLVADRDSIEVSIWSRFRPRDAPTRRLWWVAPCWARTTLARRYTTSMPSDSDRRLAVEEFVRRLRQTLSTNVVDVRLFGSEARGDATSESDIDVLVVVQPDTERVRFEDRIIDMAFDVNLDFGVYISPRVVTPGILNDPVWRETPFIKNVARESTAL